MNTNRVRNMLGIALNTKVVNKIRTEQTRAETIEILEDMGNKIQSELIEYECLKQALEGHKDYDAIIEEAMKRFDKVVGGIK